MIPLTYLFVPGNRPERFAKANATDADRIIIDLEDAVSPEDKHAARENACEAIRSGLSKKLLIRFNSFDTPWFHEDITAIAGAYAENPEHCAGVVIPKFEDLEPLDSVKQAIGTTTDFEIIGLIESAAGVSNVDTLAASGISRLAIGAVDLSVDIGSDINSPVLDHTYARLVIASRASQIPGPIASPPLTIHDSDTLHQDARRLKGMGITGQLCIHPAQIPSIQKGFLPTDEEVKWAQRVADSVGASVQVEGQMVDKPVRMRAESILQQVQRSSE